MKRILILLTVALLFLAGCSSNIMSEYPGLKVKNHNFITKDYTEIMTDMENKVPGVYYFGFPECPYCQALVPHLQPILADHDLKALTVNMRSKEFANNEILQTRFEDFLKTFPAGVNNSAGQVPFTIVISKDGIVDAHLGVTPTFEDPRNPLTEAEIEFLTARLGYLFENVK